MGAALAVVSSLPQVQRESEESKQHLSRNMLDILSQRFGSEAVVGFLRALGLRGLLGQGDGLRLRLEGKTNRRDPQRLLARMSGRLPPSGQAYPAIPAAVLPASRAGRPVKSEAQMGTAD